MLFWALCSSGFSGCQLGRALGEALEKVHDVADVPGDGGVCWLQVHMIACREGGEAATAT